MLSLVHIVERNARLFPAAIAVKAHDRVLTHAAFAARARKLASALYSLGLRHQDRFSVLSMNSADFLVAYAAASRGGFVINTINYRLAPAEMAWIVGDATPRVLLFEAQYAELVAGLRAQLASVERYVCIGSASEIPVWAQCFETLIDAGDDGGPPTQGAPDDYYCLMYTSGTTGKPKGVVHANRSIACVSEALSSELKLGGDTRLLAIAPLFHMGAATLSLGAIFRGGCAVVHRAFDADAVIRTIAAERITAMHMVPTMVQSVLDSPVFGQHDLSSLRMLMYAAAPMPLVVVQRAVAAFGPILYNGYGQTEINMLTTLQPHQHILDGSAEQIARLSSVGQAHWQCELRVIGEDGCDCAPGEVGEVLARSETAMVGYWNNTAATLATVRDGWVYTGDVGYLDAEQYLFLVDRKKDVIISGGENIYSREVEDVLGQHPAVRECAVIGVPDVRWGEAVKAIVVLQPDATVIADELIAWCRTRIAGFKCPKIIDFAAELPRLPTGKISKVELRKRHAPAS